MYTNNINEILNIKGEFNPDYFTVNTLSDIYSVSMEDTLGDLYLGSMEDNFYENDDYFDNRFYA